MKLSKIILLTACVVFSNINILEGIETTTKLSKQLKASKKHQTRSDFSPYDVIQTESGENFYKKPERPMGFSNDVSSYDVVMESGENFYKKPERPMGFSKLKQMRPPLQPKPTTLPSFDTTISKKTTKNYNKEKPQKKPTTTSSPITHKPESELEPAPKQWLNLKGETHLKQDQLKLNSPRKMHYHVHYIHYPETKSLSRQPDKSKKAQKPMKVTTESDKNRLPQQQSTQPAQDVNPPKMQAKKPIKKQYHYETQTLSSKQSTKRHPKVVQSNYKHHNKNNRPRYKPSVKHNVRPYSRRVLVPVSKRISVVPNTTESNSNSTDHNLDITPMDKIQCDETSTSSFNLTNFRIQYLRIIPESNSNLLPNTEFTVIPINIDQNSKENDYLRVWNTSPVKFKHNPLYLPSSNFYR